CASWRHSGCAGAGPPTGRWVTSRCSPPWTAGAPRRRRGPRPSGPPAGSPAGSGPGSGATRGAAGWTRLPRTCWRLRSARSALGGIGPVRFVKGHGTENDFVLLPDLPEAALTPELVRGLCDRRAGIGADGVLRVARDGAGWFMDYRNADGSVAEMCGNGVRVFGRYLVDAGLAAPGSLTVGTRGGPKRVTLPPTRQLTVHIGPPQLLP